MISTRIYNGTTDFSFDSSLVAVVGGALQLKDLRPSNATFYAALSTVIDGNWGGGVLTGTAFGGAAISGGYLDLAHSDIRYVTYAGLNNITGTNVGCIRFKITPNYTGSPVASMWLFEAFSGTQDNMIALTHLNTGALFLAIRDSSGNVINYVEIAQWSPVSGTEYEIELDWDTTQGASRVFINGVQLGSTQAGTGTRGLPTSIYIGNGHAGVNVSNFKIRQFLVFSTVQHTANYTPGAAPSETIYSLSNPVVTASPSVLTLDLQTFVVVVTASGSDAVRYVINVDGQDKYWSGASWVNSDGTYAQTSTAAEVNTNALTLLTTLRHTLVVKAYLHAAVGATTPTLTTITITYTFAGATPTAASKCTVYGFMVDALGVPISGVTIQVVPVGVWDNSGYTLPPEKKSTTPDSEGYWSLDLIESASISKKYKVTFLDGSTYKSSVEIVVPNQVSSNFSNLIN